jgi:hypothetical protein
MPKLVVANDVIDNVKWAHTLTDNTFSREQSDLIDGYFKTSKNKLTGIHWSAPVFCLDTSRWAGVVDALFERNKDLKLLYGNQRDFFVIFELVVTPPGFEYKWHRDVSRKAVTGVVYWGKEGEGTILKTTTGESQVKWKHNRALWFGNTRDDLAVNDPLSPWHRFENNSSKLRFSVNINFTPQQEIMDYVKIRKGQFLHFWNNNEPLWMENRG